MPQEYKGQQKNNIECMFNQKKTTGKKKSGSKKHPSYLAGGFGLGKAPELCLHVVENVDHYKEETGVPIVEHLSITFVDEKTLHLKVDKQSTKRRKQQ